MNWLEIIVNVFYILWAIALLVLLWLILRNAMSRTQKTEQTLIDVAMKDAESARIVAEAVRTLAAIVQNEQAK